MFRLMIAVHNSNPDAGRECNAVNLLNKCLTCLGLKRVRKRMGSQGEGDNGLRNSEWSPSPACTRWDSEKTEIRSRGFGKPKATHSECVCIHLWLRHRDADKLKFKADALDNPNHCLSAYKQISCLQNFFQKSLTNISFL